MFVNVYGKWFVRFHMKTIWITNYHQPWPYVWEENRAVSSELTEIFCTSSKHFCFFFDYGALSPRVRWRNFGNIKTHSWITVHGYCEFYNNTIIWFYLRLKCDWVRSSYTIITCTCGVGHRSMNVVYCAYLTSSVLLNNVK